MKIIKYITVFILCIMAVSCKKYLDEVPQAVVSQEDLKTPANTDAMVIAAYSALGNDRFFIPYSSMWAYGSIRGGDAYKGGGGTGDVGEFHQFETFINNTVTNGSGDAVFYQLFVGIARCNTALQLVEGQTDAAYPLKTQRQAELRFLRGHFYFLLKILFNHIPYVDESIQKSADTYGSISNVALTSDQLWNKIAGDFDYAAANLPVTQTDVGRATKGAAQAYLAKTLLYQAYTQDDKNNVTGIDKTKLTRVNTLCDSVISSGKYSLTPEFATNFLPQSDNSLESVFAIQYSKNDNSSIGRTDAGHVLDYPMNAEYGCCGFHSPSNNMVNAFKTDANGLPQFTTFNDNDVVPTGDYKTGSFDPRLDHTVAIPGHPYKYQTGLVYQAAWARDLQSYGPLLSMKETVAYTDPSFTRFPPFMSSSKNWEIIRYADVILMKAEALIQTGREIEALPLINMIRTRAGNSTALLKQKDGTPTSNYRVDTYKPGVNCTWTNAYAWQALMFERRLEFAMEGYHFFDLVRWGIAAEYINAYFTTETKRTPHLVGAKFTKNRDEYLPISQAQINFSHGLYKQNTGW
ncbi:RagB/SusD family nutrient uptake outer membrane protein [Mucilaginibacter sp. CAU 1740]|uniref:RagB/SusD family nutrient uptake outer membrane protein n=1 Tax=Mucilaginibacter sp. CAU 1740 TaxID=3140365 RepID=UPI00325C2489